MPNVSIGGDSLDVTGTPGNLNINAGFFVNINVTNEQEIVAFAEAIAAEAKKAWPSLNITIATS